MWLPGEGIPELIKDMKNPVGVEIGTDQGWTTLYLLEQRDDLTLHGVDPYTSFTDWDNSVITQANRDESYEKLLAKLSFYKDRYTHHRITSDDAAELFEDESLDFVFIDGLHTFEQVTKDMKNYYPKVKKGGLFCGHDFNVIPAVNMAVNKFCQDIDRTEISTTNQDVWYWYK